MSSLESKLRLLEPHMTNRVAKKKMGCWAKGFLTLLILGIVAAAVAAYLAFWAVRKVEEYTSLTPMVIPFQKITPEQQQRVKTQVDSFQETLNKGLPAKLALTTADLNAIIANDPGLNLSGRGSVRVENGVLVGQMSIPLEKIKLPGGQKTIPGFDGRFLNATVRTQLTVLNGSVSLRILSAEAGGNPVPEDVLRWVEERLQVIVDQRIQNDPRTRGAVSKISTLEIRGDEIIVDGNVNKSLQITDEIKKALSEPAASPP